MVGIRTPLVSFDQPVTAVPMFNDPISGTFGRMHGLVTAAGALTGDPETARHSALLDSLDFLAHDFLVGLLELLDSFLSFCDVTLSSLDVILDVFHIGCC